MFIITVVIFRSSSIICISLLWSSYYHLVIYLCQCYCYLAFIFLSLYIIIVVVLSSSSYICISLLLSSYHHCLIYVYHYCDFRTSILLSSCHLTSYYLFKILLFLPSSCILRTLNQVNELMGKYLSVHNHNQ